LPDEVGAADLSNGGEDEQADGFQDGHGCDCKGRIRFGSDPSMPIHDETDAERP
jgi:hypothetical protein